MSKKKDIDDILTDDDLRAGLYRRRETIKQRLSDLRVDEMMPGFVVNAGFDQAVSMLERALKEVDRRLKASSEALRQMGQVSTPD